MRDRIGWPGSGKPGIMSSMGTSRAGTASGTAPAAAVAVMGEQYELRAGPWQAYVTEVGGTLRALSRDGRAVLDGFAPDGSPAGAHGQALIPWPNRVDRGRYVHGGARRQLD